MREFNSKEAAQALGVSIGTIKSYVDKGLLNCEKIGLRGRLRFSREDLEAFAKANKRALKLPESKLE